ncbi:MAG: hypothetical protein LBH85_01305 [Treponema sp.]|jgi:hypothetical protein|nr:hypothetical protein [Treponema sp.]
METMTAEQAAEWGESLSFEKVWAALMEGREQMRKLREMAGELSKNVSGLNRSMGEIIETLVASQLREKSADYPYNLKRACQRVPLYDENSSIRTDIDILLSDAEWAMAVEVKRELNRKDEVDDHVRRMALVREYSLLEAAGKKLLGAIAGGVVDPDVKERAIKHKAGFFALELSGGIG